jgi:multidrug transporter EmrE-like cation transporter
MYSDLRALGVSVCFTRFMKKMERESLLISALVLALKFRCSSKCMPRSLKDLRLGLAWELWIRSISKISSGLKGVLGMFESSISFVFLSTFLGGDMKDYIFSFADVKGHSVALKPNGHFSKFHANPSHECL